VNLLDMASRLKRESGRSGDPITTLTGLGQSDQRLVDWIRTAWEQIQADVLWSWTRKSATGDILAGVHTYLPSAIGTASDCREWWPEQDDYKPIVGPVVDPTSKYELSYLGYDWVRRALKIEGQTGAPQYWAIGPQNEIVLYPIPVGDWTIDIDYRAANTTLPDGTSTPNLPLDFHMALVWRALMEVASFDAAPEVYARAKTNFEELYSALRAMCAPRYRLTARPLA
jgi:hypothetical protein